MMKTAKITQALFLPSMAKITSIRMASAKECSHLCMYLHNIFHPLSPDRIDSLQVWIIFHGTWERKWNSL